jgi:hypothetical protein
MLKKRGGGTGLGLVIAGTLLMVTALLGEFTGLGDHGGSPPRPWERFDDDLAARTRTPESLVDEARMRSGVPFTELGPEETMEAFYGVVTDRFTHREARHTWFSNWLLFSMGKVHPAFGRVLDTDRMVRGGHSLFCDQISYLLLDLALGAGVRARHVGLNGHVVMEAWYDGDWHLFDPDMEVVPRDGERGVLSVEDLSRDAESLARFYSGPRKGVAPLLASREDNTFVSYPQGAWFEWKTNLLARFGLAAWILKFLLPAALVLAGILLMRARRR